VWLGRRQAAFDLAEDALLARRQGHARRPPFPNR
jgi:hypothetical protein